MIFYNLFEALKAKIEAISISGESQKVYLYDDEKLDELKRLSVLIDFEIPEGEDQVTTLGGSVQEIQVIARIYYTLPKTQDRRELQKIDTIREAVYKILGAQEAGFMLSDVPGNQALAGTPNDQGLTGNIDRIGVEWFRNFTTARIAVAEAYAILYRDNAAAKVYIDKEPVTGVVLDPRD